MAKSGEQTQDQNNEIEANRVIGGEGNQNQINADGQTILRRSLEERIEKKEEQTLKMEASVFQLANYYFVFQGVILTAIIKGSSSSSSSSSLKCKYFFIPFLMSLIGASLNFGALLIIADKYKESLDQLDEDSLILYQHLYPKSFQTLHKKHKKKKARRQAILVLSLTFFFIFAVLNLVGTLMIPCLT